MAVGQPGDTAEVSLEGPYEDEGKHWVGGTVLQHQMMEQLEQTSPRHGSYYREKQRSTRGHAQLQILQEASCCTVPYLSQFIQIFLQQHTVQAMGAALQPKSVPMFRTCFHPHLAEEDPSSVDTGGSWDECHRG